MQKPGHITKWAITHAILKNTYTMCFYYFTKKLKVQLVILLVSICFCTDLAAQDVKVRGYYRKDGTYVQPHYRSRPNHTKLDNWSTKGNVNPYTGKRGTKNVTDRSNPSYYYPTGDYNSPTYVSYSSYQHIPGFTALSFTYDFSYDLIGFQLHRYLLRSMSGLGYLLEFNYMEKDFGDLMHMAGQLGISYNFNRNNHGLSIFTGLSIHNITIFSDHYDPYIDIYKVGATGGIIYNFRRVAFQTYYDTARKAPVFGLGYVF